MPVPSREFLRLHDQIVILNIAPAFRSALPVNDVSWDSFVDVTSVLYTVTELTVSHFVAEFNTFFNIPEEDDTVYPPQIRMPHFAPFRLCRQLVDSTNDNNNSSSNNHRTDRNIVNAGARLPQSASIPSMHTLGTQRTFEGTSSRTTPSQSQQRRPHIARGHNHDSESDTEEDGGTSTKDHRPSLIIDKSGRPILFSSSKIAPLANKTEAMRNLAGHEQMERLLEETGNQLQYYTLDYLLGGADRNWLNERPLHGDLTGGALIRQPTFSLVWRAGGTFLDSVALLIVFFQFVGLESVHAGCVRLGYFLTIDRALQLGSCYLSSYEDWMLSLDGMGTTFSLIYGPQFGSMFRKLHREFKECCVGLLLDPLFLEYWTLKILSRVRQWAQSDGSTLFFPTNRLIYPHGLVTHNVSCHDWAELIYNEFHANTASLLFINSHQFVNSRSSNLAVQIPDAYVLNSPPSVVSSTTIAISRVPRALQTPQTHVVRPPLIAAKSPETPRTRTPGICCAALLHDYKIPVVEGLRTKAGVPPACAATCKFLHVPDYLSSQINKEAVLRRTKQILEKLVTPGNALLFANRVTADTRF